MLQRVIDVFKMILVQHSYRNFRFSSIPFLSLGIIRFFDYVWEFSRSVSLKEVFLKQIRAETFVLSVSRPHKHGLRHCTLTLVFVFVDISFARLFRGVSHSCRSKAEVNDRFSRSQCFLRRSIQPTVINSYCLNRSILFLQVSLDSRSHQGETKWERIPQKWLSTGSRSKNMLSAASCSICFSNGVQQMFCSILIWESKC